MSCRMRKDVYREGGEGIEDVKKILIKKAGSWGTILLGLYKVKFGRIILCGKIPIVFHCEIFSPVVINI